QLKNEISESVKADLQKIAEEEKSKEEEHKTRYSISGNMGVIAYEAVNIESDFAGGVSFGYQFKDRMDLDFGFLYSRHLTQDTAFSFQKFNQYNLTLGLRYGVLPYFIRP